MYSMAIETAFYTNQTNLEFCQLELFFIIHEKYLFINYFFYLRKSEDDGRSIL